MLEPPRCDWLERNVLEAPASFNSTADLVLGTDLRDPERLGFARRTTTGQTENWRMRQVTLFPALGLVFKDGRPIDATRYCILPGEEPVALKCLAGHHHRLEGRPVFIALNRVCGNYFHILTQLIPAVAGYRASRDFSRGVLLLNGP